MCGIFGVISTEPIIHPHFIPALTTLQHRGPDDSNYLTPANAFIGHTRLSIIDLSEGKQPMTSSDGNLKITFNGEIFNYAELRRDLQAKGYEFLTHSDTEVILVAFQHYGPACLHLLRGMFAFAIYNQTTGELFAARDRFGIKPFFYAQGQNCFIFSSEIKAIYKTGLVTFEPQAQHFNEYLIFGYIAGEETLHRHIKELNPAHYLVRRGNNLTISRYWYPFEPDESTEFFEAQVVPQLEQKITEAVQLWTTADVEVASLLSGGVDSPLVTKLAGDIIPRLKTFSAYFPYDAHIDETPLIRLLIQHMQTQASLIPLADTYLLEKLYQLVKHFDEPIHDANYFTLMSLCQGIRNQSDIKVVLCGEGADEVFGGYRRHQTITEKFRQNGNPDTLLYAMNSVAIPRLKLFTDNVSLANPYRYTLFEQLKSRDSVNMALELDQQTFLGSYLHRQDRVGMMFGLEIRTPYLEHELVAYVNQLPGALKIKDNCHKWILRKVAEKHLPPEVVWRTTKTAFAAPVARMLDNGELKQIFQEVINPNARLASYYSIDGIRQLLQDHHSTLPDHDHSNTLWRILSLELWLDYQLTA